MTRRGKGQFQFTIVELTALALSFTATSGLVFLLGVYVGREAASRHVGVPNEAFTIPVDDESAPGPVVVRPPDPAAKRSAPGVEDERTPARPQVRTPPVAAHDDAARASRPAARAPEAPVPVAPTGYTVQVLETRSRREAEGLVRDLKGRGYGAFLKAVEDGGGRYYRVRVGQYDELSRAKSMAERCRRDLGLSQAYVLSY